MHDPPNKVHKAAEQMRSMLHVAAPTAAQGVEQNQSRQMRVGRRELVQYRGRHAREVVLIHEGPHWLVRQSHTDDKLDRARATIGSIPRGIKNLKDTRRSHKNARNT